MKYLPTFVFFLTFFVVKIGAQTAPNTEERKCAFDEIQKIKAQNLGYQKRQQAFENAIQTQINNSKNARTAARLLKIPVVVHVIHAEQSSMIGQGGNITDAQINAQFEVLNEDFRRKENTPGFNTSPIGADIEVFFELAKRDPNGQTTTGITRTYNAKRDWSVFTDLESIARVINWPSDRYLNIWVVRLQGDYLGFASFPSVPNGLVPGLDNSLADNGLEDGFFVDFRYFGKGGAVTSRNYNMGRTATHELGHWLGLYHTWGDAFCGTDYCNDTPVTETPNQTTSCNDRISRCDGSASRNMIENYMDYSPDRCMNIFTADQKNRMRAALELSPRRKRLIDLANSIEDTPALTVTVEGNPSIGNSYVKIQFNQVQDLAIDLISPSGVLIDSQTLPRANSQYWPMNYNSLPNGLYHLRVRTASETVSRNILIQK
jgi:Pregnancy-associated plasma protein-A